MSDSVMSTWTVYWSHPDYPDRFAVVEWEIKASGPTPVPRHLMFSSLEAARRAILKAHPGAVCFARHPNDEPYVVETWL